MTTYEPAVCPVCTTVERDLVAARDDVRDEVEALWAYHLRRLRPSTPPERLTDRLAFSQPPPVQIRRCRGCGTLLRDPRERAIAELYAEEHTDDETLEALFEAQRKALRGPARRLRELAGPVGRGLEVGSYTGAFLTAAAMEGLRFEGIDVNERANRVARGHGLTVRTGTIEDVPVRPAFDAVAIVSCLEQLPDPAAAVRAARDRLRPGGWLLVRVPNGRFYASARRGLSGPVGPLARAVLAHSNLLGFPYRHGFTPDSLTRMLEAARFRIVDTVDTTLLPVDDRWTRGWAVVEQRMLRTLLRRAAPWIGGPWIQMYAQAVRRR